MCIEISFLKILSESHAWELKPKPKLIFCIFTVWMLFQSMDFSEILLWKWVNNNQCVQMLLVESEKLAVHSATFMPFVVQDELQQQQQQGKLTLNLVQFQTGLRKQLDFGRLIFERLDELVAQLEQPPPPAVPDVAEWFLVLFSFRASSVLYQGFFCFGCTIITSKLCVQIGIDLKILKNKNCLALVVFYIYRLFFTGILLHLTWKLIFVCAAVEVFQRIILSS